MKRSRRLDSVLKLAENRERQAAAALARANQQLAQRQAIQHQLLEHQREYRERISPGASIPAMAIKSRRAFVEQLQRACEQQFSSIEAARREVEQARSHWLSQRVRYQSLEKARDQMREDERSAEERREQARLDDLSQYRR